MPASKVDPTPDCVNAATFAKDNFSLTARTDLKRQLGIPTDKKVLVYLGVLTTYQGVDKLLEALSILRETRNDFHLLLMGYPAVARFQAHAALVGVSDSGDFYRQNPL